MKVKICPLCDSEMKRAHYCEVCKSFVWHPEMADIHYDTEDRGLGEIDCAYGTEHDRLDHDSGRPERNDWYTRKKKEPVKKNSHQEVFGNGRTNEKFKKIKKKGLISKIIAAVIGLNVIGTLLGGAVEFIFDRFESFGDFERIEADVIPDDKKNVPEDGGIDGDAQIAGEDADSGDEYIQISDKELEDYPYGCNGHDHFEITGTAVLEPVTEWLVSRYNNCEVSSSSYNAKYIYDNAEYVYLDYETTIELPEMPGNYAQIESDSVTDQIHAVYAMLPDEEDTKEFLVFLMGLLNDELPITDVRYEIGKFIDDLSGDYNSIEFDNIYIYVCEYSDGNVWVSISPRD